MRTVLIAIAMFLALPAHAEDDRSWAFTASVRSHFAIMYCGLEQYEIPRGEFVAEAAEHNDLTYQQAWTYTMLAAIHQYRDFEDTDAPIDAYCTHMAKAMQENPKAF